MNFNKCILLVNQKWATWNQTMAYVSGYFLEQLFRNEQQTKSVFVEDLHIE